MTKNQINTCICVKQRIQKEVPPCFIYSTDGIVSTILFNNSNGRDSSSGLATQTHSLTVWCMAWHPFINGYGFSCTHEHANTNTVLNGVLRSLNGKRKAWWVPWISSSSTRSIYILRIGCISVLWALLSSSWYYSCYYDFFFWKFMWFSTEANRTKKFDFAEHALNWNTPTFVFWLWLRFCYTFIRGNVEAKCIHQRP